MKRLLLSLSLFLILAMPCEAVVISSRTFDGTDDEVDGGNILDVTTGDVSYGAWTKLTENAVVDHIIGKRNNGTAGQAGYALYQTSTDLPRCSVSGTTNQQNSNATTDTDGAWHFCFCTWDGTNSDQHLYVDGVQEDTDTNATVGSLTNAVELAMGEIGDESLDATGSMAYGMVFLLELSPTQVKEIMWNPGVSYGHSLFWTLWGTSPEIDYSGSGNTGTVNNAGTTTDGPPVFYGMGMPL